MYSLKKLLLVIALVVSQQVLFAQKNSNRVIDGNWSIEDVIYINKTQGLGHILYSKKEEGVVLVNSTGKAEWDIAIKGHIIGISKWKENAIAFCTEDWNNGQQVYSKIRKISAVEIDLKTKTITASKIIFDGTGEDATPVVKNDPSGNFSYLLLHQVKKDRTSKLTLLFLQDNGTVINKELSSAAIDANYVNSYAANNGNIFIASIVEKTVFVEKFDHNGDLLDKLKSTVDIHNKSIVHPLVTLDTISNNTIFVSLSYSDSKKDARLAFYQFNFDEQKVYTADEMLLNKSSYKFSYMEKLKPFHILSTKDKIVVVKEIQFPDYISNAVYRNTVDYYSQAMIVSVYDKQLHLQHEEAINKNAYNTNSYGQELSCFVKNDALYIVSNENINTKSGTFYYVYDLNTNIVDKQPIDFGPYVFGWFLSPRSTFWFEDGFIVSDMYYFLGITGSMTYKSMFKKMPYNGSNKAAAAGSTNK